MIDIALLNAAQTLLFAVLWAILPYRKNPVACFHKKLYRRTQFIVFAIAIALSILPIWLTLQDGLVKAIIVADLNIGSCFLVSLLWRRRPRYASLNISHVPGRIIASYIWPLALIIPIRDLLQSTRLRSFAYLVSQSCWRRV
jgi:hypothetical protein